MRPGIRSCWTMWKTVWSFPGMGTVSGNAATADRLLLENRRRNAVRYVPIQRHFMRSRRKIINGPQWRKHWLPPFLLQKSIGISHIRCRAAEKSSMLPGREDADGQKTICFVQIVKNTLRYDKIFVIIKTIIMSGISIGNDRFSSASWRRQKNDRIY